MNKNLISALIIVLIFIGGIVFLPIDKMFLTKNLERVSNFVKDNKTNYGFVSGVVVGSAKSDSFGEYLTDTKGMTLYTFADDKKSFSNCTGDCLKEWPIFEYDNKDITSFTDVLSKKISVVKRVDNSYQQYAYNDKLLYYYAGDKNPGDTKGQNLDGGKWSLVLITK